MPFFPFSLEKFLIVDPPSLIEFFKIFFENLTILFISHDLPVVRQMCDRIGVLKDGKLCEVSNTEDLFLNPTHEYTKELLHLMPKIESIYN